MVKSRLLMVYPMIPCRIHCVPINSLLPGNYPYYRVAPITPNTRGCWGDCLMMLPASWWSKWAAHAASPMWLSMASILPWYPHHAIMFCRLSHQYQQFLAEIPWRSARKIPWSHHFHWVKSHWITIFWWFRSHHLPRVLRMLHLPWATSGFSWHWPKLILHLWDMRLRGGWHNGRNEMGQT